MDMDGDYCAPIKRQNISNDEMVKNHESKLSSCYDDAQLASQYIMSKTDLRPKVLIICGSGLGNICDSIDNQVIIPYADIPHVPISSVIGHGNILVVGHIKGTPVVAMKGRVHFYEGYEMKGAGFLIRALRLCGLKTMLVTSAVGGINLNFKEGDAMIIKDHINLPGLCGHNPLIGQNDYRFGTRFPVMAGCYDKKLGQLFKKCAAELGYEDSVREGVMAVVSGPNYETPAEIRFLRIIGADTVGMSVGPDVVCARHCGYEYILGVNLVTNICTGRIEDDPVSIAYEKGEKPDITSLHQTVLSVAQKSSERVSMIMKCVVEQLPEYCTV